MPPTYQLLPLRRWATAYDGQPFQIGERTKWEAVLRVARVSSSPAGSITVILEASPTLEDRDWSTLASFTVQTTEINETLDATKDTPDFTVDPRRELYFRASVSAVVGEVIAEVTISCPFFDLENDVDLALLSQEVRGWKDGKDRIVRQAEDDVLEFLLSRNADTGHLDIDLTLSGAHLALQKEIVEQAEYLRRKHSLERQNDPSAQVTVRDMGAKSPTLGRRLRPFRSMNSLAFYGR